MLNTNSFHGGRLSGSMENKPSEANVIPRWLSAIPGCFFAINMVRRRAIKPSLHGGTQERVRVSFHFQTHKEHE
jgi:hypothetical protein